LSSRSNGRSDFGTFLGALRKLGYSFAYRVLDAQCFLPQRRKRVFVVAHHKDWRCCAAVLFKRESLQKHTAKIKRKKQTNPPGIKTSTESTVSVYENHATDSRVTGPLDVCPTITRRWGTGGNNTPLVLHHDTKLIRKVLPEEAEELMGFEPGYTNIEFKGKEASNANRYKALGNSMAVPVLSWITRRLLMTQEVIDE